MIFAAMVFLENPVVDISNPQPQPTYITVYVVPRDKRAMFGTTALHHSDDDVIHFLQRRQQDRPIIFTDFRDTVKHLNATILDALAAIESSLNDNNRQSLSPELEQKLENAFETVSMFDGACRSRSTIINGIEKALETLIVLFHRLIVMVDMKKVLSGTNAYNREANAMLQRTVAAHSVIMRMSRQVLESEGDDGHLQSTTDFHINIVKSSPKAMEQGRKEALHLQELSTFLHGSMDMSKIEEFENSPGIRQDCRVVKSCQGLTHTPYRTLNGSCNNLDKPDWGSAFQPFLRYLSPQYGDGLSKPRIHDNTGKHLLPSAREVSRLYHGSDVTVDEHPAHSHMVMQWGQFLDHDISFTPAITVDNDHGPRCCLNTTRSSSIYDIYNTDSFTNCFPIPISSRDQSYRDSWCMSFPRSVRVRNSKCRVCPAEQMNQITAFVDASNVYGSSEEEMDTLRSFSDGKLFQQDIYSTSGCSIWTMLPFRKSSCGTSTCFDAGDGRVNEHVGLASTHALFVREHNRIAGRLHQLNSHWDDERIFQETKKIIGAMMQVITYNEFLPLILGTAMNSYNLKIKQRYSYRPEINPTIRNVFATAAFRFGHSQIRSNLSIVHRATVHSNKSTNLRQTFKDVQFLMNDVCLIGDSLRGLTRDHCPRSDRYMSPEVTEHLFEDVEGNSLDLAALNIQRGRDHGLTGYNHWRKFCKLRQFNTFAEMTEHTAQERNILQQLYRSPNDVDVFTAAISERPVKGGVVGQTLSCLLSKQFAALKFGDRFWFENTDEKVAFTSAQLKQLYKTSLSKVLCQNTETSSLQPNSFRVPSSKNPLLSCRVLIGSDMNLEAWAEPVPV